jgi:hypothetical protein
MPVNIQIADNGTITANGAIVNSVTTATAAHGLWSEITQRKNWSIKNIERVLAYGAALVAATNGFSTAGLPPNIREWLLGASALIISAIHVSTPKV